MSFKSVPQSVSPQGGPLPELSLLLPVRGVDSELEGKVRELVDTLADEVENFEVLLLEQAPTEAASEMAAHLAAEYTQVRRVPCMHRTMNMEDAASLALGSIVLIHDSDALDLEGVVRMYRRESAAPAIPAPSDRMRDNYRGKTLLARDQLANAVLHRAEQGIRVARKQSRQVNPTAQSYRRSPKTWGAFSG